LIGLLLPSDAQAFSEISQRYAFARKTDQFRFIFTVQDSPKSHALS